jgi:hypothetical protein
MKDFIKIHQQAIVLCLGYLLVAALGFGLGRISSIQRTAPEIRVEEAFAAPNNYTPNVSGAQTISTDAQPSSAINCAGQIKGSKSLIYHVPGGAFYDKTTSPIRCFNTEAEAQAAGFRKSSK